MSCTCTALLHSSATPSPSPNDAPHPTSHTTRFPRCSRFNASPTASSVIMHLSDWRISTSSSPSSYLFSALTIFQDNSWLRLTLTKSINSGTFVAFGSQNAHRRRLVRDDARNRALRPGVRACQHTSDGFHLLINNPLSLATHSF